MSTKGVLPEPAEAVPRSGTEQPEARAGSGERTAEAGAGAGRHGCCEASMPILSLRRFGGSERSLCLAAA